MGHFDSRRGALCAMLGPRSYSTVLLCFNSVGKGFEMKHLEQSIVAS
jgi:hypothetical protein